MMDVERQLRTLADHLGATIPHGITDDQFVQIGQRLVAEFGTTFGVQRADLERIVFAVTDAVPGRPSTPSVTRPVPKVAPREHRPYGWRLRREPLNPPLDPIAVLAFEQANPHDDKVKWRKVRERFGRGRWAYTWQLYKAAESARGAAAFPATAAAVLARRDRLRQIRGRG
jgi:hypothetical protein